MTIDTLATILIIASLLLLIVAGVIVYLNRRNLPAAASVRSQIGTMATAAEDKVKTDVKQAVSDAEQRMAEVWAKVPGLLEQVQAELSRRTQPPPAAVPAQAAAPAPSAKKADAAPAMQAGEGLAAYAQRIGLGSAVTELQVLSRYHPADTWPELVDRYQHPEKFMTAADLDTIRAATRGPQQQP